jgi:hypothetical protein
MAHLPQDGGEIIGDRLPDRGRQAFPDLFRLDRHAPSLPSATAIKSSTASTLSLARIARETGAGSKSVVPIGSSNVRPNRYFTLTSDSPHDTVSTEIRWKRRP